MTEIKEENVVSDNKAFYKSCWNLETERGRQVWKFQLPDQLSGTIKKEKDWQKPEGQKFLQGLKDAFYFDKSKNPNSSDLIYRNQALNEATQPDEELKQAKTADDAFKKGFSFYEQLQSEEGHWPGDYGGPHFLTPGLIIVAYITNQPFPAPYCAVMGQYFFNHQNEDGGWGLHIEDSSTMFGTVLQYIALRILGVAADDQRMLQAKSWIHQHGGATGIPPWGKFYLSLLGLYEWKGNDSLFPELWIFPRWLPFHPGRFWNHCRMVYLPMAFCYGEKYVMPETELIRSLRKELYTEPYDQIDWKKSRKKCADVDVYRPLSKLYKVFYGIVNIYEKIHIKNWRRRAQKFIYDYIKAEDIHTNHIDIGPVNKALNSLVVWIKEGKSSDDFQKHQERWYDYLWLAEDGMKMNGYNGSQLWDTAFASQALLDSGRADTFPNMTKKIYNFLDISQVREDVFSREKYFRTPSEGGWPFSTNAHGWPITDCTAEGIKSTILLNGTEVMKQSDTKLIGEERLCPSVDFLLLMQNPEGGWASYEERRAPKWIEKLNPSMIFGDIMTDYNYVECTSASVQALAKFNNTYPDYRAKEIEQSIKKAAALIRKKQRADGSWYGSWAVCFTYGTWFGIEGLLATGAVTYSYEQPDPQIAKACEFLASIQKDDGSWGESFQSCVDKEYVAHSEGQVVNTGWALLALMAAEYPDQAVIDRGIAFLINEQEKNGDWRQQGISGVFNGNCMITYTAYRNVFPLWALGRYARLYQ